MAKKGNVTRTEKVTEYVRQHPDESISEVLTVMRQRGIQVSRSVVSQVRKSLGVTQAGGTMKKSAKKKAAKKKGSSSATAGARSSVEAQVITADDLYEAKKLSEELGGVERLREALDALERLR